MKNIVPLFLMLILLGACKKPQVDTRRQDAVKLYGSSVKLLKNYTDSFLNASDSASLLVLNENFKDALTRLNFKFPAETCLSISEGENDTLTNLTERIVALRDSLLYAYAHPALQTDSIVTDSITAK